MPTIAEALQSGLEHHRAGELAQAERMYRLVLDMHPSHAGAVHLMGLLAYQVGKLDLAERMLRDSMKMDAFNAAFPADIGEFCREQGRFDEALALFRKSLELNDQVAEVHHNVGLLLERAGSAEEAEHAFRRALALDPAHAGALLGLARWAEATGRLSDARVAYEAAVRAQPTSAAAYLALGKCLAAEADWHGAITCFQKASRLEPEWSEPHYCTGLARLALGEFTPGWRDYHWRLRGAELARRVPSLPLWNGAELAGHRLLVWADGDLSDTLQFVRYVPLAAERGATPYLCVPAELHGLLSDSGFTNLYRHDEPPTDCHLQTPLGSLPGILGTTLTTIPCGVPYLSAREERVAMRREQLRDVGGFKIGVAWRGESARQHDALRSIPLAEFAPLAAVPSVRLVSLETSGGPDAALAQAGQVPLVNAAGTVEAADGWAETAATIAACDLVVTAETAIAQLAGALGVPVWVALSTAADWRWLQGRDDSPWYPNMRLFRQRAPGAWAEVFARLADEAAALVSRPAGAP